MNNVISVERATEILRENGFDFSLRMVKEGIIQKVFPFGVTVNFVSETRYIVYRKDLQDFMEEHTYNGND